MPCHPSLIERESYPLPLGWEYLIVEDSNGARVPMGNFKYVSDTRKRILKVIWPGRSEAHESAGIAAASYGWSFRE